jgi:replicative DNA helicase
LESRLPPQNIPAEMSVLGGLMLEPEAWDEVADILSDDDFYRPAHRVIFAAVRDLSRKAQPIDLVTVTNHLIALNQLESAGGPTYIAELLEQTPTTVNIKSHAQIIKEKSLLRRLISTGQSFVDRAYTLDFTEVPTFINEFESAAFKLGELGTQKDLTESSELVKLSIERLEYLFANKGDVTGISTGFFDLDKLTSGLQPKELIIIAARPSMGKTAFSLNMALHAALREKKSIAYFSVEMAKEQLMIRALASEARISLSSMRTGQLNQNEWTRLIDAAAKISDANFFIDDTSGISPYELHAKARRIKAKKGLDLIMVDYLQLMNLKQRVESREREVSEISKTLKAIAKDLSVPVIALAQLNRGVEGRSDKRPMLSDLRESGSIEQDADVIMMLYREDYYDKENPDARNFAEVIISKQRNGPTDTVRLRWQPEIGLFANNITPAGQTITIPGEAAASGQHLPPSSAKPKNYAPTL